VRRRDLLRATAATTFIAGVAPRLGFGADRGKTLIFTGVADLSVLDPVVTGARPTQKLSWRPGSARRSGPRRLTTAAQPPYVETPGTSAERRDVKKPAHHRHVFQEMDLLIAVGEIRMRNQGGGDAPYR